MKKTLIALAVLALVYVAVAWTTGRLLERQLDAELAKIKDFAPQLAITEDVHTAGVFGSTRLTTFDLGALVNAASCPTPTVEASDEAASTAPALAFVEPRAEPLLLSLKQTIRHGPLPGFGLPAAAAVRYQLLINGKAVGDEPGLSVEGEMPVLTARYGFTGNSHFLLAGAAGKLRIAAKDGKGAIQLAWPSLRFSSHVKANLSAADYQAELPLLELSLVSAERAPLSLQLKGFSLRAERHYPTAGQIFVYTGSDYLGLESLIASQDGKPLFTAQSLLGNSVSSLNEGLLASVSKLQLASVQAGGETVGPLHYDFSIANLDAQAYGQLMEVLLKQRPGNCPSAEQAQAFTDKLKAELPALLKTAPEFRIDRLSVTYQGQQALLTGQLKLPAATAEQLDNPFMLMALATATLNVSLPDKLIEQLAVRSLGSRMATQMALTDALGSAAAIAPPPTPEQQAQARAMAQALVAEQLQQALAKNWVVRVKDGVSSRFEYRNGGLLLNGLPLDLNGLRSGAAATPE